MDDKAETESRFRMIHGMLCPIQGTENTRTKDDADSHAQIPATPPGIQQAARTKNRTKTWRTEEVQSDDQTIPQRNQIQTATRNMAANKIDITTGEAWIELQQGSPRAAMDVGATCSGEWPGDREITATVRNAMADNVADRIHRLQAPQAAASDPRQYN